MPSVADEAFEQLLEEAQADPNILGLFLSGSRGKGFGTPESDYDVYIIVRDEALEIYRERYPWEAPGMHRMVYALDEFSRYADYGGEDTGDRYSFAHVQALVDKTGRIRELLEEKGRIPEDKRLPLVHNSLDAYINSVYRSAKCFKKGNQLGARLEAAEGTTHFLTVIFAWEGRHRPFYGYLERELAAYPLRDFPLSPEDLLAKIDRIAATGDLKAQQELLETLEGLEGCDNVFAGWGETYPWLKSFVP
jgi:hypothetical protein